VRERLVRLAVAAWAASLSLSAAVFASDPGRDAWVKSFETQHAGRPATAGERLASAVSQFGEGFAYLELVLALAIAAGCSMVLAWTPVAHARKDAADILESKKILVALGVVGAVVAGLVTVNPAMGLVIFGIGGLIRFRTVLEHPRLTAKAILCVLVGLAAGLNQFVTAGLVTVAGFLIVWWIERSTSFRLRVKLPAHGAAERVAVLAAIDETLRQAKCHPRKLAAVGTGRNVVAVATGPSSLDTDELADRLRRTLLQVTGQPIEVEVRMAG
jgi:hypothetical protein